MRYAILISTVIYPCSPEGKPDNTSEFLDTGKLELCEVTHNDAYTVAEFSVQDDVLTVFVSYSGGCETHSWELCWDGSIAESMPQQVWFELGHEANNDTCEAMVSEEIAFDISSLEVGVSPTTIHLGGQSITINQDEE